MTKRALLVGIDHYPPGSDIPQLKGCLNDVTAMHQFLSTAGFTEFIELRDNVATASTIRDGLRSLCTGLRDGDRVVFHYAGHGTQYELPDGGYLHDSIVPFDYDNSREQAIIDVDLTEAFSNIPTGATLFWISDSCCSGALTPLELFDFQARAPSGGYSLRSLMPSSVLARIESGAMLHPFEVAAAALDNVIMISACDAKGVAGEAEFDNKTVNGVLTRYLLDALNDGAERPKPLSEFHKDVHDAIMMQYPQESGLHGDPAFRPVPLDLAGHPAPTIP